MDKNLTSMEMLNRLSTLDEDGDIKTLRTIYLASIAYSCASIADSAKIIAEKLSDKEA